MTLQRLWSSFRAWPGYAQVLAWVIAWPIVAALLIAARARGTAGQLAALGVLLVGGSVWFGAFVGPDTERTATTTPVQSEPPPPGASDSQPSPTPEVPDRVPPGVQPAVVERIVDGDTIWVRVDDAIEGGSMPANATSKVRLLEIDAPEATSTRECGGNKATAFVRKMTPVGAEVWLQADVEDTDRYGRFLRYVWLDDGRMLNRLLVRRGWAEAVLYEPNDLHWRRMRAAERKARTNGRGVWGVLCAPEPEPEPAPAPAPAPEPQLAPEPDAACHPSYEPCVPIAPDVDCAGGSGDGPEYTGQVRIIGPDEYGLDADGDGTACEDG